MYHYAGNNPINYTDPDGNTSFFNQLMQEYSDYLTSTDKAVLYTLDTVDRASQGDPAAQANLQYAFHQVNQDVLQKISDTSSTASLVCVMLGNPELAGVFGSISLAADGLLVLDNLLNGDQQAAWEGALLIAASFVASEGTKAIAKNYAAKIQIHVGKNGRYYELGRRGALKSKSAFIKLLKKDIASGYFGQNIAPELASQIVSTAGAVYDKVKKSENGDN